MRIYLACPYSHTSRSVRIARYEAACAAAAYLMQQGHVVFSPISHSHPISEWMPDQSHEFWIRQDESFLCDWAERMYVLTLSGWNQSRGVAEEVQMAYHLGIPLTLLDPDDVVSPKQSWPEDG